METDKSVSLDAIPVMGEGMFSRSSYWDDRYAKKDSTIDQTEWIFNFESMKQFFSIEECRFIVDIGCGISPLLHEIRASGYTGRAMGIDFSNVAVDMARVKFPGVEYVCADAETICKLCGEDKVDIVIDKTSIDSILCGGRDGRAKVIRYCEQVGKVLREDGIFIWATFQGLEPYGMEILNGTILPGLSASNSYHGLNWSADIHIWEDAVFENANLKPTLYIFRKTHISPRFLGHDVSSVETTMHYH
jgi:SAM-dependent methyltransferase